MKHIIHEVDKYLDRQRLAEESGVHYVYLCQLMQKDTLSPKMRKRILEGIRSIIKHLTEIVDEHEI